jgi:hypothetical protein
MATDKKTSILIPSQLPEFIRDNPDYSNFVEFLTAYYEWMEQTGKVTDRSKNLLSYHDIDETTNEFIDYFVNEFLPYFPEDALVNKKRAVKIARQLYSSKGTPASYSFLFKLLYDSDFDYFDTKDVVLRASDGIWYVAKSIRVASIDPNLLKTKNLRVIGETSKTIATIENVVIANTRSEIYISDITRLFQSGEFVNIVDTNNQLVLFDGIPIRVKILGQINQIRIDPNNRGQLYAPGDPVVIYGGLASNTGIGGSGIVGETTKGSIQRIGVVTSGYGYAAPPGGNTIIQITNAGGAIAEVGNFDSAANSVANVSLIIPYSISRAQFVPIGNTQYSFISPGTTANANTKLIDAFTNTASFFAFPISAISVKNGGGGISADSPITIEAISSYPTDVPDFYGNLRSLGILAPIQIRNGGTGYAVNNTIVFSGGLGYGAAANVTAVSGNGKITQISYVLRNKDYPPGGMGYTPGGGLPTVTVSSSTGSNAEIYVDGILGSGATFSTETDRIGSITRITTTNFGEDYVSAPSVSIKVQDIVVSNLDITLLSQTGNTIFQGANLSFSTYRAVVDSFALLEPNLNAKLSKYRLRVFNYDSKPDSTKQLKIPDVDMVIDIDNENYANNYFYIQSPQFTDGVKTYGDGTAKGTVSFLNGLSFSQGQYLNSRGQPSSFSVLQNENYNDFTYQITVEKEIAKYRDILLNLLHPSGTKLIGRYALRSSNSVNYHITEGTSQGKTLYYYTQTAAANAVVTTDFNNLSSNTITFYNLGTGVNIANIIYANSTISLSPTNGPAIHSEITSIRPSTNSITIAANTWLTFPNVANVSAVSSCTTINIESLTGTYNVINNGVYSNPARPLVDIVYAGDQVRVNGAIRTVTSVDYNGKYIIVSAAVSAPAGANLSVSRTFSAGGTLDNQNQIIIYGPVGTQYFPELITESGQTITTEDDITILLG